MLPTIDRRRRFIFTRSMISQSCLVLRASPYVQKVSPSPVFFSAEFKEKLRKKLKEGVTPRDAVESLGIDPKILGENRIAGLKAIVRKEVKAGEGFRDYSTYSRGLGGQGSKDAKIRFLEQQLAYKDQEIEFLKKIVSLGSKGETDT